MDFAPDETQKMLIESVNRFVQDRYGHAARQEIAASGTAVDRGIWRFFGDMGWLSAGLPEQAGGFGGGPVETMLICEALGRGAVLEPVLASAVLSAQTLVAAAPDRAADLLEPMLTGTEIWATAYSEPDARAMALPQATRAAVTDGGYVIDGRKTLVLGGAAADRLIVSARLSGAPDDGAGIALFLVPADRAGIARVSYSLIDGQRVSDLTFRSVEVSQNELIATSGIGFAALQAGIEHAIAAASALAVGTMERAVWMTRDYVSERRQFGVALGSFQAVQHHMADMFIELELARSMTYHAVAALEHSPARARTRAISLAKVRAGQAARFVGAKAIQLHGGMGLTEEYFIGDLFRSLVVFDQVFGDLNLHAQRLAAIDGAEARAKAE